MVQKPKKLKDMSFHHNSFIDLSFRCPYFKKLNHRSADVLRRLNHRSALKGQDQAGTVDDFLLRDFFEDQGFSKSTAHLDKNFPVWDVDVRC